MRSTHFVLFVAAIIIAASSSAFADPGFEYSPVGSPPGGEKNHAQILGDTYLQNFTPNGVNYVGNGGITAYRVYDRDDIIYNTTHVYNHLLTDVDQIWTDGAVTVTAYAKYASYNQAFGWNGGGTVGTNFIKLLDQTDLGGPGESFIITEGQEFLWGHQAWSRGWYQTEKKEWWSEESENSWHAEEDHMVTYYIDGASLTEAVWMVFIEDEKLADSDCDYNDFVIEIRAIPEPATIMLLGLGALALLRKRKP